MTLLWVVFGVLVGAAMFVDLGVLNRRSHAIYLKEDGGWCAAWISLALLFCAYVSFKLGAAKGLEFLTGYLIEYSLSVDNLFVFIIIFEYFAVDRKHQPRILHWGILGAVLMRFIFIFVGIAMFKAFHWVVYLFGAMLVYTGLKLIFRQEEKMDPGDNPVLKAFKRCMPFVTRFDGESFFTRANGIWHATPLFATLIVVEASDVVFAIDSIPAILAITADPFIVYTSNVFAIMGLRSLFFVLSGIMPLFRFLKYGISIILCYIGVKMLLMGFYHIPTGLSLAIVASILSVSILASLLIPERAGPRDAP